MNHLYFDLFSQKRILNVHLVTDPFESFHKHYNRIVFFAVPIANYISMILPKADIPTKYQLSLCLFTKIARKAWACNQFSHDSRNNRATYFTLNTKSIFYAIEMTGALIHKTVKILAHEVVHKEMNTTK